MPLPKQIPPIISVLESAHIFGIFQRAQRIRRAFQQGTWGAWAGDWPSVAQSILSYSSHGGEADLEGGFVAAILGNLRLPDIKSAVGAWGP